MARLLTLILLAGLLAVPAASASSRLTIRGAGFGHGVGMSQYGAYGFAQHGAGYREILAHYYRGTGLGTADAGRTVRVLLQSAGGAARFTGAARAGSRTLDPARTYRVRRRGSAQLDLLSARFRRLATFTAPLQVAGPAGTVTLTGRAANGRSDGAYRGILEFRPGAFVGVDAVNLVGLDEYVQGVVPAESPASWPLEALKAQAVAARTYAITTSKGGAGFDQYPDTRSQVYGGVGVETPATNQAVADTAGEVVTYEGKPVVTYFFSTSGGRTESVENTSLGREPRPWLQSVDDPYDDASPRHRWGPIRMSTSAVQRRLGGLVRGGFRGVKVLRRGRSPRVVAAEVIGTRGRTRVDGATLRARFRLYDTWAFFTSIASREAPPPEDAPAEQPPQRAAGEGTGGVSPGVRMTRFRAVGSIAGEVVPARRGERLRVEAHRDGRWRTIATAPVRAGGAYRLALTRAGTYRVVFRGDAGPDVRVG